MADLIIGIDCATQPKKMGLARAARLQSGYRVTELMVCDGDRHPVEVVAEWIGGEETVLLALDAPPGWAVSLGRELAKHAAGHPIVVPGELLASLRGYKSSESVSERQQLLEALAPWCEHSDVKDTAIRNHDCLDALACVVAGVDFLEGAVVSPGEPYVARREGWIWFREPGSCD